MRLIRQFLKDFNLTEDQALKILFHSIKAMSKKGALILEFETPVNNRPEPRSIKYASALRQSRQ